MFLKDSNNFIVDKANSLVTARTINGTSFNGTGNITTANWGTTRTLTVGNTGKSVNGSANITWTLAEIGAAASSHTHGLVNLNSEAFGGGNDLNTYNSTKTWVARTLNTTTNRPADYYTVANFGAGSNSNFQLAHSYGNSSTLYVRGRHDTSGNYTPWAKVYTDKNKPTPADIGAAPVGYGLGTTCQDKSGQDCNNILVTGFYRGSSMTNKPSGCTQGWIYLLVMSHDNASWVRQVAYDFGTASQVYTRVKQNGSWTSWVATDTNTWRGIQNNLTSTATDQSLSAAQGKILNDKITSLQNTLGSNTATLEANINSINGIL